MTIEVRQMLIRTLVSDEPERAPEAQQLSQEIARAREQILAECKAWLAEQLRDQSER